MHRMFRFNIRPLGRLTLPVLALTSLPLTTAAAQDLPRVRVTQGDPMIRAMRYNTAEVWRLMRAETGMVFEVLDVDGDRQRFVESNYYLVLLPRDAWGTQWVGWISGRYVAPAPPRERAATAPPAPIAARAPVPRPAAATTVTEPAVAAVAADLAPASAPALRVLPEVVLHFAFDRSQLSEAAKDTLSTLLASTQAGAGDLSFALGGHADTTGSDAYNHKLGLARAEAVRRFIAEQMRVSDDRVSVTSYGETRPVASNATAGGRAENRRVVVTVTAAP